MKLSVRPKDIFNKEEQKRAKEIEKLVNYVYEQNEPIFDLAMSKIIRKWMQETDYDLNSEIKVEWIEEVAEETAKELSKYDYIQVPKL